MPAGNEATGALLSVRLTTTERAEIVRRAGDRGISAYVRSQLFESGGRSRAPRIPRSEARDLAQVLALLGSSQIADDLRELSRAAAVGALPISPETEKLLQNACRAVDEMRQALIAALGLPEGEA